MSDFSEFSEKSLDKILNKEILFQGYKVLLKALLQDQISQLPLEILMDDTLSSKEEISIGNKIPDFLQYCLPHRLQRRTSLRLDFLNLETVRDVFAMTGTTIQEVQRMIAHRENVGYADDSEVNEMRFLVMDESKALDQFKELCRARSNVHWFHVTDGKLLWKMSQSDNMQRIKWYMGNTTIQLETILDDNHERVIIIAPDSNIAMCDPLPYLAQKAKEKNPSMWIIHIRIDKDTEEYFGLSVEEVLMSAAKINSPLEKELLRMVLNHTGNILVLVDVCYRFVQKYEEKCCGLLKRLLETKIKKAVVTCHDKATTALENSLSTLVFTVVKFEVKDQIDFLHNFWTPQSSMSAHQLRDFVENTRNEVNAFWFLPGRDPDTETIGITNQTAMIAEVFRDYVIDPTSNNLPEKLNVINMFQQFVEKKSEAHLKVLTTTCKDVTKEMYIQNHEHAALMNFMNKTNTQKIFQSKFYDIEMSTKTFLEQVKKYPEQSVFVTGVIDGLPRFTPSLVAAYFAGKIIAKHYKSNPEFILEQIYKSHFEVVRFMFDGVLSKDFKLHTAVIHNDTRRAEVLLSTGEVSVDTTDRAGRTALHLAATLRNSNYSFVAMDNAHDARLIGPRQCHVVEILISHGACLDIRDLAFHLTPLEYALKTKSLDVMEYLLASGAKREGLIQPKQLFYNIAKCVVINGFVNLFVFLLECGLPVDFQIDRSTILHKACWYGHVEIVKLLISRGADRRALNDGNNVLHTSVERRHISVVRALLESPEKVTNFFGVLNLFQKYIHTTNSRGESSLHIASRSGFLEIVKLLISHGYGQSSLHHACNNAHIDVARIAVENSKEKRYSSKLINKLSSSGESALSLAVLANNPSIMVLLLTNGADVWLRDDTGKTLLHLACQYGCLGAVKVLIDSCNNLINSQDKLGRSPLHLATWAGHTEIVSLLVTRGGDICAPNLRGRTCFHLASWKNKLSTLRVLVPDKESIASYIDAKDEDGKTALHLASYWGFTDVIAFLIAHGADTNIPDDDGRTCLHLICMRGNISVVESIGNILQDKEESLQSIINAPDKAGKTALHLACFWGYSDIVQFLVLKGGDVQVVDSEGSSCLHLTAMRHELNVAQIIVESSFGCDAKAIADYINLRDKNGRTARDVAMEMERDKDIQRDSFVIWLDIVFAESSKQAESQ